MSLASFAFSFPNYWTAKLSRCMESRANASPWCPEGLLFLLMSVDVWKEWILLGNRPSRQEVEMWLWLQKNSLEDHPEKSCSPCRSPWLLPLREHLPSCLWGHLLVQSSFGTNKAVPHDPLSLCSPGERLLVSRMWGTLSLSTDWISLRTSREEFKRNSL